MAKYGSVKYGTTTYGAKRTLETSVTTSVTLTKGSLFFKILTCTITTAANIRRSITKILTSTVALSGNIQRTISKTLTTGITSASSMTRTVSKILTANVTTTVLSIPRSITKIITVTVSTTVSINRYITKILATATVSISGTIKRMMATFKQLFPSLTVTKYPIEMSVTEYRIKMEVVGMAIAGSTITLRGEFPDSAGILTLLGDVTVKIYGPGKILLETITNPTEESIGIYSAEYTTPSDKFGQYDYEFSGLIGGITITDRDSFPVEWK